LVVTAVGLGLLGYVIGDRTNWSGGFGFDGRFYGELAKNFGSAVFGHGRVVPPGLGFYRGPRLSGVDTYYARRLLPSAIVWLALRGFGLQGTHAQVVLLFSLLGATMFGLATFCWCRTAELLGFARRAKVVGAIGLIVSFAVLKTGSYYPVLTDQVALGLGALSLYLWLRRSTVLLALSIVAGCFTWPLHIPIGFLLLLFPPPADLREQLARADGERSRATWHPSGFGMLLGGLAAGVGVSVLAYLQGKGYRSAEGTEQVRVFPLSLAVVGVYVFAVVAFLAPVGGMRQVREVIGSVRLWRVALAVMVVGGAVLAAALLARRPGLDGVAILKDDFWSTTLAPGLFAVVIICYYGPLFLVLLADLPRVAADAWLFGPAMVGLVGLGLLGALLNNPREIIDVFPFLLVVAVLAARRIYILSWPVLLGFFVLAFALARLWFPIGNIGVDLSKLGEFPAQRYFMASGLWTSPRSYALQLPVVACVGLALWFGARAYGRLGGNNAPLWTRDDVSSAREPRLTQEDPPSCNDHAGC
jgi:hypothetical protein